MKGLRFDCQYVPESQLVCAAGVGAGAGARVWVAGGVDGGTIELGPT